MGLWRSARAIAAGCAVGSQATPRRPSTPRARAAASASGGSALVRAAASTGVEATVRAKFTTDVISGALGGGLFIAGGGEYGGPLIWGHLGVHALQLDVIDATPYLSAFSPYLTGGVGICVDGCGEPVRSPTYRGVYTLGVTTSTREQTVFTIGLAAEYDVRFVRAGEGFFGLSLGVAFRSQQNIHVPF